MSRRVTAVAVVMGVLLATTTAAWAAWTIQSSNARGSSAARLMPTAAAPSVSATGSTVTVTWSAASFSGGPAVSGYVVRSYDATTNALRPVGGTCTGTVAGLTCNDTGVADGSWQYTVQTRQGPWSGTESAMSATVTVSTAPTDTIAPTTTDNAATVGTGPHNTTKTVTLTATDDTGGSGVAATYYTTNGTNPTTSSSQGTSIVLSVDGTYTIKYFSVDVAGNAEAVKTASTVITIDKTAPVPTGVVLVGATGGGVGGVAGKADQGDRVNITVSERLTATTLCSTWVSNPAATQTINANNDVTVTITDAGANDVLTVSSASATCTLGSVSLGGNYVSSTATFRGTGSNASTISWNPTTMVLSVVLGNHISGSVNTGVALGNPAWTPSSLIKDLAGNSMAATAFTSSTTSRF